MKKLKLLKPCPFCGWKSPEYFNGWKKGNRRNKLNKDSIGRNPSITCEKCGIGFSAGFFGRGISDRDAQKTTCEAWNRRDNE